MSIRCLPVLDYGPASGRDPIVSIPGPPVLVRYDEGEVFEPLQCGLHRVVRELTDLADATDIITFARTAGEVVKDLEVAH